MVSRFPGCQDVAWVSLSQVREKSAGGLLLEEGSGFGCSHDLYGGLAGGRIHMLEARRLASDVDEARVRSSSKK